MIARHWHGQVPVRHAGRFAEYLRATGIAEAASLPGYAGARAHRTAHGIPVEFELPHILKRADTGLPQRRPLRVARGLSRLPSGASSHFPGLLRWPRVRDGYLP